MSSYIPIASQTLASSASSVTFSSIPTTLGGKTLRDLVLIIDYDAPTNYQQVLGRFNSDTGSNYNFVSMEYGSQTQSLSNNGFMYLQLQAGTAGKITAIIQVMDYSQTNKHKSLLSRFNIPTGGVDASAHRWASTSAITTFQVYLGSGSFPIGATFSLYGIEG